MEREEDHFLETRLSYGLVLRGDLAEIQSLKDFIDELDLNVIYQTTSAGRLWIVSEEKREFEGSKSSHSSRKES